MEGPQRATNPAWCVFYGLGIIGSLVLYGIFQEGIMTVPYDGSLFTFSVFLVLCNRLAAVLFAVIMAQAKGESMGNQGPIWKYLIVSLSNVYASSCQYEALKYVSFAVQMLGKSFKMMPVMIWGIIISGKSYSSWTDPFQGGRHQLHEGLPSPGRIFGVGWVDLHLSGEALQGTSDHQVQPDVVHQPPVRCGLLRDTAGHRQLLASHHLQYGAPQVLGRLRPSEWVGSGEPEFGALVFAATMNVRQVVSILVSYVKYHNPVTALQILGLLLIFAALFFKSIAAMLEGSKSEKKPLIKGIIEDKVEGVPATDAVDKKV